MAVKQEPGEEGMIPTETAAQPGALGFSLAGSRATTPLAMTPVLLKHLKEEGERKPPSMVAQSLTVDMSFPQNMAWTATSGKKTLSSLTCVCFAISPASILTR